MDLGDCDAFELISHYQSLLRSGVVLVMEHGSYIFVVQGANFEMVIEEQVIKIMKMQLTVFGCGTNNSALHLHFLTARS